MGETAGTAAVGAVALVMASVMGVAAATTALRVAKVEEKVPAREVVVQDPAIAAPGRTSGAEVVAAPGVTMGAAGTAPAAVLADMTAPAPSTRQMNRVPTTARSPWRQNCGK